MRKFLPMLALIYLVPALLLEVAILPQTELLLSEPWRFTLQLRLLALGAILFGMLRGELAGMLMGLAGALLLGFSTRQDWLGASLVGFALVGYLAGLLARHFRLGGLLFRCVAIFFLLVIERLVFNAVLWIFWRNDELMLPWPALLLTALLGTLLYGLFAPLFKRPLYLVDAEEELAGR